MCSYYILPLHGSTVRKSHLSFASLHLTKQIKSAFVVLSQKQKITRQNNIFASVSKILGIDQTVTGMPNINTNCRQHVA